MNDAVLIQQCYPGYGYEPMIELTRERNARYCEQFGFDYQVFIDEIITDWKAEQGSWAKTELILQALEDGYKYIVWLDADALIYDLKHDLRKGCPEGIGVCWHRIPQLNHWNVGVMLMQNTPEVRAFMNVWQEQFPGDDDGWNEQGAFNRLGRLSNVVQTMSDRYNATLNANMVPDAVILGFHGYGNTEQRYQAMKETLQKISIKEAVGQAQEKSEAQ